MSRSQRAAWEVRESSGGAKETPTKGNALSQVAQNRSLSTRSSIVPSGALVLQAVLRARSSVTEPVGHLGQFPNSLDADPVRDLDVGPLSHHGVSPKRLSNQS